MSVRILIGDNRDMLRTIPDKSVQCAVTSPPYFGLRSYLPEGHDDKAKEIGLEPTPDAYVAEMVAVFREVRRVLRDDGTLWLNLGSSYAGAGATGGGKDGARRGADGYGAASPTGKGTWKSPKGYAAGGTHASQSRPPQRDPSYDSRGTEPLGCSAPDCAYRGRDGEPPAGSPNHHDRIDCTDLPDAPGEQHPSPTNHDSEPLGSAASFPGVSPRAVPASSARASFRRDRAACVPTAKASASPPPPPTSEPGFPVSADTSVCTCGTAQISAPSAGHMSGTASSGLACDCGSCGICWAYLAIPLLCVKAKDLLDIPHLVALALQADGWFYRQDICWHKPSPMPESVTDRCTKAHESVFLLSKSPRYYFDAAAIAEESTTRPQEWNTTTHAYCDGDQTGLGAHKGLAKAKAKSLGETRNRRSVWTIATQPYSGAHFATMPPDLARDCILAGSSERGQCPHCGAPWVRQVERTAMVLDRSARTHALGRTRTSGTMIEPPRHMTTGWAPSCGCPMAPPVPQMILDPFGGAGTTALVADRLRRDAIIIELNPEYAALARERINGEAGMFAPVAAE